MLKKIRKKYYNKILIGSLVFILSVPISELNGQGNSFLLKLSDRIAAQDIIEDSKGCLIAGIYTNHLRISPSGKILWDILSDGAIKYFSFEDSNSFYYIGGGDPIVGSFEMGKYDLRGKNLFTIWREPENETHGVWDFIYDAEKKILVACGQRYFIKSNQNFNYWIAGIDLNGNILWENNIVDSAESRFFRRIFKNPNTGGYILLAYDENQTSRCEFFNVDSIGNVLQRSPIEPNPEGGYDPYIDYRISNNGSDLSIGKLNDTIIVATVIKPNREAWFYFYNMSLTVNTRVRDGSVGIEKIGNNRFVGWGATDLTVFTYKAQELLKAEVYQNEENEYVYIKKVAQSRDGGYYGIAQGFTLPNGSWPDLINWVYIFKTDSLGKIRNVIEYSEKEKPVMLQPNPARDSVRVAIPYYYGNVSFKLYNIQGSLIMEKQLDEQQYLRLQGIPPGIYVIHASLMETGETRKMKLIVQ